MGLLRHDYRSVATAHVEVGWVPPGTRADEFEAAIRAVCEPIFDRPLHEISFGNVLLRLFQTSRRFNVEGLGRQLDPDLDLWKIAKPFLERWMNEQLGWRAMLRSVMDESPDWPRTLPQLPRLLHQTLRREGVAQLTPHPDPTGDRPTPAKPSAGADRGVAAGLAGG